jgi:hypothetical protein
MLLKNRTNVAKTSAAKQISYGLDCAYWLNSILSLLTRTKKPFAIPIKVTGIDVFKKSRAGGVLLCSLHLPLSKVALRCLLENGIKLDVAIAADHHLAPSVAVWGITEVIPAIDTGSSVLIKAKSILGKKGTVVALVDKVLGLSVSPNSFLLAHKLKAQVIYFLSELMADGTIAVSFLESAISDPDAQQAARLQINELTEHVQDIISRYERYVYKA